MAPSLIPRRACPGLWLTHSQHLCMMLSFLQPLGLPAFSCSFPHFAKLASSFPRFVNLASSASSPELFPASLVSSPASSPALSPAFCLVAQPRLPHRSQAHMSCWSSPFVSSVFHRWVFQRLSRGNSATAFAVAAALGIHRSTVLLRPAARRRTHGHHNLWGSRAAMARRICAMMQSIPVFIRRVTARYTRKGSNGSKSHPKAGLSWPMASP